MYKQSLDQGLEGRSLSFNMNASTTMAESCCLLFFLFGSVALEFFCSQGNRISKNGRRFTLLPVARYTPGRHVFGSPLAKEKANPWAFAGVNGLLNKKWVPASVPPF